MAPTLNLPLGLVLAALALYALSGLQGLCLGGAPASRRRAQRRAATLVAAGALIGLGGLALHRLGGAPILADLPWGLPGSRLALRLDDLSALFLLPVFLIPPLASIYGLGYRPADRHERGSRRLDLGVGLLCATMGLVLLARDGLFFLVAWEAMALSAWLAATVEEDDAAVQQAGWVYLVATHAGTLCLIAFFALWQRATGSLLLDAQPLLTPAAAGALFLLALPGFGVKAGLMPLHVWLPGLHAGAPSQVSALLSGVMLSMGLYGLTRVSGLLPALPAGWGAALLALGAVAAVAGMARGLMERHLKRLLACSSMENIGVMVMGLGLALLGRALQRPDLVLLGLGGALLHMVNHAVFKTLLFFGAGAVLHATGTGLLDRLGGLGPRMPRVTALCALGALGACALPPLNGFVGEWLLYLGCFRMLGGAPPIAAGLAAGAGAAAALALAGALALAAFIKVLGTGFLGEARSKAAERAHDPGPWMLVPMLAAGALSLALGLAPQLAAPWLEAAVADWSGTATGAAPGLLQLAPLGWISALALLISALSALLFLLTRPGARHAAAAPTWDCGLARPEARMQTTAGSLARTVEGLLAPGLHTRGAPVRPAGLFPAASRQVTVDDEFLLDRGLRPAWSRLANFLRGLRVFQQGLTQHYVLYILAALLGLLLLAGLGSP